MKRFDKKFNPCAEIQIPLDITAKTKTEFEVRKYGTMEDFEKEINDRHMRQHQLHSWTVDESWCIVVVWKIETIVWTRGKGLTNGTTVINSTKAKSEV